MDWFEKIKGMNKKELASFLSKFDADDITDSYCETGQCNRKDENGYCKHNNDCPVKDSDIIELWLSTKASDS